MLINICVCVCYEAVVLTNKDRLYAVTSLVNINKLGKFTIHHLKNKHKYNFLNAETIQYCNLEDKTSFNKRLTSKKKLDLIKIRTGDCYVNCDES